MTLTRDQIIEVTKRVIEVNESNTEYELCLRIGCGIYGETDVKITVFSKYNPDAETNSSIMHGSIKCNECSGKENTFEHIMQFIEKYDELENRILLNSDESFSIDPESDHKIVSVCWNDDNV